MSISATLGEPQCVQLSGGPIAYRERGRGAPVVFVHGLAMNGDLWRDVVPPLADGGLRCITPDWPLGAHDLPMDPQADLTPPGLAGLVCEFLERLDLRNVTLVGNDTGGAVCQLVAAAQPDRLGRLVLASCDAFEVFPPKPFGYLPWLGKLPGAVFLTTNAMRVRALRRLPLAYGLAMREHPDRPVSDSYVRSGYESAAIRRDTKKMLRGLAVARADAQLAVDDAALVVLVDGEALGSCAASDLLAEIASEPVEGPTDKSPGTSVRPGSASPPPSLSADRC
jgi:pimeloyl-ACP methyl ester carboxylesterase